MRWRHAPRGSSGVLGVCACLLIQACSSSGDSEEASAPTVTLTATPGTVDTADSAMLAWSSTDATSCQAAGDWSGPRATSGTESTGSLTATATFDLTCSGPAGAASDAATVAIRTAPEATVTLTATPTSVAPNGSATLDWSSTDATSCTASGAWDGPRATSGSTSTGPLSGSMTFDLECTGPGGSGSDSATVIVTGSPPPSQVSFTRVTIDDGQAPWGKNLADVDGDGFLDVLVGGGNLGGDVYWYRYPDWTRFHVGSVGGGDDLQPGDIDSDGAMDIVVNGRPIVWYENPRGSGGNPQNPWTRHTIDPSARSHDVAIADIDRDGDADVAARSAGGTTRIYYQDGPDSWHEVVLSNASVAEGGLFLADIDSDGRIDVLGTGYWLEQPDDPLDGSSWQRHTIGSWPAGGSIGAADLDQDGHIDVLLASSETGPGEIAWFEAPDDPIHGAWIRHPIDDAEDVHRVHLADVDRDGQPDIVFAEMHQSSSRRVGVYYNEGLGSSWDLQLLETTGSHNIAVGDIGLDGDIDILGANHDTRAPDGGRIQLWRNDLDQSGPTGLSDWTHIEIDTSKTDRAFGLALADLNHDGRRDVVAGRYWYRNPGRDLTSPWTRVDFGGDFDAMVVLDVDGDGRLDVIAEGTPSGGSVPVVWLQPADATATSWTNRVVGSVPADPADGRSQGYALGQIVPGGLAEIALSTAGLHYLEVPEDPVSDPWPITEISTSAREEGIALGDIDRDGDLDVAGVIAPAGTSVGWWENAGGAPWTQHVIGSTSGIEADRVALADLSRDGRLDLAATEANNGTSGNAVFWFEQPADPADAWTRRTIASSLGSQNSLGVADMNHDGRPDVVTGEHRGPSLRVTVWVNTPGAGGIDWVEHRVDTGNDSHLGTRLVDADRDGDLDIVSIAFDAFEALHLWRNDAR